jgi:hypothetical protein
MSKPGSRARRPCWRLVVAAAAAAGSALLGTACGTSPAPARVTATAQPKTDRAHVPADSRAGALAYGHKLLASLHLPPGARVLPWPAKPVAGLDPSTPMILTDTVDVRLLYAVSPSIDDVYSYLLAHQPTGAPPRAYGEDTQSSAVTSEFVDYTPGTLPAGIFSAELDTTFKPAPGGGALLRADALIAWYPPRSPADLIDAARYDKVTISHRTNHATTRRTFTSPAEVLRLAAVVNGFYGAPDVVSGGGGGPVKEGVTDVYEIVFTSASGAPTVVMSPSDFLYISVTVGGRSEPSLAPSDVLLAEIKRLLAAS